MRIISGIQPTGPLHLGNYLGAIKNWLELQKDKNNIKPPSDQRSLGGDTTNECFFFIADYHSLTESFEPAGKYGQIMELGAELLALGLDPKKSVLFIQSQVPQVTELAWIFNCITPISFLERMTQYKDKSARQTQNINAGLFDYPVLQAADILLYHGEAVPVGRDQVQHVELASDIARFFNNRFGEYFKMPKAILTPTPKIMSLLEPEKKMSKSLGVDHCVFLSDPPAEIERKIRKAVTDIGPIKNQPPHSPPISPKAKQGELEGVKNQKSTMSPGVENLFLLLDNFGKDEDVKRFRNNYASGKIKYAELKEVLAKRIADYFADFRKKKETLFGNPEKMSAIYSQGSKKAQEIASKTLEEVRKLVGLRK